MTSGNGKEAFESAAEIGVGKSYNNKQFAQIFKGIRASIEDAAAESGRDPIVDDGNTGALPPTEYPDPDYPALEPGDIWIDANGSLNFYYNGQWNQVKVYTKNVLPDDDSPLRIITPNDESFDNQEDYNEWLYTRTDRQPIHSDTPPLEHPDFPAYDLKDGDYWIDYNNHLYYWDYSKQAWVPIAGSNARTAIYSPIPPTLHPDYDPPDDALVPGDTWYDTDNQFKQYVYNGTDWILITNYVSKEGGDTMEGPLEIAGDRFPNTDGIESTIKVLNVDSGENSDLQLKQNGAAKVYVGSDQVTVTTDLAMHGNKLKNLGDPVENTDAATKKYVDDNAGGTLQAATSSVLGGVKIGSGVSVTNDGKISVSTSYASSSHTHSYASTSHNHNSDYVKGNYTITKSNGNYYIQ